MPVDLGPIDAVPPVVEVLHLAPRAVVPHVHVFPRAHTQQHVHVDAGGARGVFRVRALERDAPRRPGAEPPHAPAVCAAAVPGTAIPAPALPVAAVAGRRAPEPVRGRLAAARGAAVAAVLVRRLAGARVGARGGLVLGLAAEVGARVGRAGEVGVEHAEFDGAAGAPRAVAVPLRHEPREARPEHGGGRGQHLRAQRRERAEGLVDLGRELGGHVGALGRLRGGARDQREGRGTGAGEGYQGFEEEVVVVGHGGVVEKGGIAGIAGVFDGEGLGAEFSIHRF